MSINTAKLANSALQALDIRAIYEHYVTVYATRDVEEIKKNHSVDSRFWLHNGGKPVIGRDAIAHTFAETFRRWPQTGFEVYRTIFHERGWILDWAMTAVLKGPDGSDRPVRFDALDVVDVDEAGLVRRKDTFVDFAQVKRFTDGPPLQLREFFEAHMRRAGFTPPTREISFARARLLADTMFFVWSAFGSKKPPPLTPTIVRFMGQEITVVDTKARRELGYAPTVGWPDASAA